MSYERALANARRNPDVVLPSDLVAGKRRMGRRAPTIKLWKDERQFMAAVIAQCDALAAVAPVYGWVYHVSNENSHRQPGVRAGVPDLALDVARYDRAAGTGFHGWRCELKVAGNDLSPAQRTRIDALRAEGYYVAVVWDSVEQVLENLAWYLALNEWR